jgi:hypothetical protein
MVRKPIEAGKQKQEAQIIVGGTPQPAKSNIKMAGVEQEK